MPLSILLWLGYAPIQWNVEVTAGDRVLAACVFLTLLALLIVPLVAVAGRRGRALLAKASPVAAIVFAVIALRGTFHADYVSLSTASASVHLGSSCGALHFGVATEHHQPLPPIGWQRIEWREPLFVPQHFDVGREQRPDRIFNLPPQRYVEFPVLLPIVLLLIPIAIWAIRRRRATTVGGFEVALAGRTPVSSTTPMTTKS